MGCPSAARCTSRRSAYALKRRTPDSLDIAGRRTAHGHNPAMATSRVKLPRDVRGSYAVFLNGVPQAAGVDYTVREGVLVFERELRKDNISGWRWLLGAWGVGTYRQNDSVDVRYEAADGSPRLAEGLEIEPG